jgi:tetratricopeptide (TPR) repeat protein
MSRCAWLLGVLALAACDRTATAVDRDRAPALVARGRSVDFSELDRLAAEVKQSPADHLLADRYRQLAVEQHASARALRQFQQLAADPTIGREANVHYQLGMAYIDALQTAAPVAKAGLAGRALESFDAALARDPNLWDAWYAKGLLYLRMPASFKQYPKAIATFSGLLAHQSTLPQRPEFALTYLHLGEAYLQAQDRKRAESTWREGLRKFPDLPPLRDALADLQTSPRP